MSLIDTRIAELQAGLPHSSAFEGMAFGLPALPIELEKKFVEPHAPASSRRVRRQRRVLNHENKLVKVLTVYGCMKTVATNTDMRSLTAVALSSTHLWDEFKLHDKHSYDNWARLVTARELYSPPVPVNTKRKREREKDESEQELQRGHKRVMGPNFRMSVHDR